MADAIELRCLVGALCKLKGCLVMGSMTPNLAFQGTPCKQRCACLQVAPELCRWASLHTYTISHGRELPLPRRTHESLG